MDIEDSDKFELDIKNTALSNMFILPGFVVAILYIVVFNKVMQSFSLPEMVLIALFVFAYSLIKIIYALTQINLEYKPRIPKDASK